MLLISFSEFEKYATAIDDIKTIATTLAQHSIEVIQKFKATKIYPYGEEGFECDYSFQTMTQILGVLLPSYILRRFLKVHIACYGQSYSLASRPCCLILTKHLYM